MKELIYHRQLLPAVERYAGNPVLTAADWPYTVNAVFNPGVTRLGTETLLLVRVEDRTGGGDHFQVTVAAPSLSGLSLLDQHRRVNDALAEPLRDGTIHELRIKTRGTT